MASSSTCLNSPRQIIACLSHLYVRKVDIEAVNARHGWEFRTKHEQDLDLCRQVMQTLKALGSKVGFIVVFDGAYAAKALVRPLIAEGATIVTRLHSDAKLFDLLVATPGQRGRPSKYGKNRISLAKRAGHREGWQAIRYMCRGALTEGRCKTFLATSHIVGGAARGIYAKFAFDAQ